MNIIYNSFKMYCNHKDKYIVENYIRHKFFDSVIATFNTLDEAEDFMDSNELWGDCTLFGVDCNGRAYYPNF